MFKKVILFIFVISFFSFFVGVLQTKAQPLTSDQFKCYLSGDANDPMYKKYFDICWKQTGAKSTGAIINCMNTYPEFVEWDIKNKEKCASSSPSPAQQEQASQSQATQPPIGSNYVLSLIDKPPKESDFRKVDRSDFKLVYPIGTSSANLKPATQSADLKGRVFIGKVGGEGEVVIERTNGDSLSLKDDMTAHDGYTSPELRRVLSKYGTSTVRNVVPDQHIYYREVDCQILLRQAKQDQEMLQRLGFVRKASDFSLLRYDIVYTTQIGNCDFLVEDGPVRVLIEQGRVTFRMLGDTLISVDNADFGVFYDSSSSTSFVDIYNGSVKVSNKAGQVKTISSVYGSEIKQIEVAKDGVMSERIAIPQSEWETFLASQQERNQEVDSENSFPIVPAIAVLGMGGLIFFLYRTGRLKFIYEKYRIKISKSIKKD